MGILVLSTLARVRRAANKTGTVAEDDAMLLSALAAASQAMQSYCSMQWYRCPQVETRACNASGITMLRAKPVISISSVEILPAKQLKPQALQPNQYAFFDGNELHYPGGYGPLDRVIASYIGGVATSTTTSTEAVASCTGTPVPGDAISAPTAQGSIAAYDPIGQTVQIAVSDGTLFPGDTLTGPSNNAWSLTLGETLVPSIISDYCDLANACDQQASYIYQRRNTPGRKVVVSGNGAGTTFEDSYKLLPGVIEILEYYDHQFLG